MGIKVNVFICAGRRHQKWFKTVQQHSRFWTEYLGETRPHPQQMVAELQLTDPLPELVIGGVLELGLSGSVSRISATICWGWKRVSPKYLVQKHDGVVNYFWGIKMLQIWKSGRRIPSLLSLQTTISPKLKETNIVWEKWKTFYWINLQYNRLFI